MTDARLLGDARLLLAWSASLEDRRQSFDDYVKDQTGREALHAINGGEGARTDLAGHSVRVPSSVVTVA